MFQLYTRIIAVCLIQADQTLQMVNTVQSYPMYTLPSSVAVYETDSYRFRLDLFFSLQIARAAMPLAISLKLIASRFLNTSSEWVANPINVSIELDTHNQSLTFGVNGSSHFNIVNQFHD